MRPAVRYVTMLGEKGHDGARWSGAGNPESA